jgi:Zn-dependent protease
MAEERKRYTSFHDIPPREYMYFPKGSLDAGNPGKFSRIESIHLLISIAVLTIAFSFLISSNNLYSVFTTGEGFRLDILPYGLLLSFLCVVTAFFFHEISHKIMAQKHKLWAEYRMFPHGLGFALIISFLAPFVFAAPGAVMFRGGSRDFETGQIAMAGPLANIIVAGITLLLYQFVLFEDPMLGQIVLLICFFNALLATFNLLPFGPLDGTKIIRWNATIWIIMLIVSIIFLTLMIPRVPLIL